MKVITPNCRVQFTAEDVEFITKVLDRDGNRDSERASCLTELLADEASRDVLLDNEALLQALMDLRGCLRISSHCYFYILVRHALRRAGIQEREVADYIAEVLSEFSRADRLHIKSSPTGQPMEYFFEMLAALKEADDLSQFLIRAHMGNQSLFMTGVFPSRIRSRCESRGFPGLDYYESLGQSSFREASHHRLAERYHLAEVFDNLGAHFHQARQALNDLADRVFSVGEDYRSIDALLRRFGTL
ncbi:MAG: hypothetical protein JNN07_24355 [Verrucomicrobiales bacterium]|nr:hypothetical protein [Verrucomicrobiales bacterium]